MATFDPTIPNDYSIMPAVGNDDMDYVRYKRVQQPIVPVDYPVLSGYRAGVEMDDTPWPYRVIALTVWTDPAHPGISSVMVNPDLQSNAYGNNTPEHGQSDIYLVDVAGGLPASVADPSSGDLYGIMSPSSPY